MILTLQQQKAMRHLIEFFETSGSQVFILRGYAGTGKTTMISSIVEYLHGFSYDVRIMAPTGRAAKVLRSKIPNCGASTIHRAIYSFDRVYCNASSDNVKYIFPLKDEEKEKEEKEKKRKYYEKYDKSIEKVKPLYIVDEASMIASGVSTSNMFQYGSGFLMEDLLEKAKVRKSGKIIFVGDPMQLPPVGEEESLALDSDYFKNLGLKVMEFELTDVIRQGKDSLILTNAMMCRSAYKGLGIGQLNYERKQDEVMDIKASEVALSYCNAPSSSAIICWSNKQAARYNNAIRDILFPGSKSIRIGDRLMVVSNSYLYSEEIMNGDVITVTYIEGAPETQITSILSKVNGVSQQVDVALTFRKIEFRTDDGRTLSRYIIESLLNNDQPSLTLDERRALYINMRMRLKNEMGRIDETSQEYLEAVMTDPYYNALQVKYGYAFTCHKAQGGEWDNVYVDLSNRTNMDRETLRWNYTAITRASKRLMLINGKLENPFAHMIINPIGKMSKMPKGICSYFDYQPTISSLKVLTDLIGKICEEAEVEIKGVVEGQYRVAYYFKTTGKYSNIAFTFDKTGNITTARPSSDILDEDEKLNDVVNGIMDYIIDKCI